ncbi:MAG: phosphoribosyltransferase domain-containing protein [Thiotrichaceae bacterium]|nr:phosphoribosyltransferase domain-containing protein [Thiotrichaceae bacterium]
MIASSHSIVLPTGELNLNLAPSDFKLDNLTSYAARQNPKRGFLFVSKLLAKYWPSKPTEMQEMYQYLASVLASSVQGKSVFVGMAEAAAGLGQGVYEAYLALERENTEHLFIHTSRYLLAETQALDFQEQHSHAAQFYLYVPPEPQLQNIFVNAQSLVLIDDELTTGRTFVNLIKAYQKVNSNLESIIIVSILNFVDLERQQEIQQQLGRKVKFISALAADVDFTKNPDYCYTEIPNVLSTLDCKRQRLSLVAGRLGIQGRLNVDMSALQKLTTSWKKEQHILVLGTGEFVHVAFLMGQFLVKCGWNIRVQSTARSPLVKEGVIKEKMEFIDNYADNIPNYLYNVKEGQYDHIVLCHETPMSSPLQAMIKQLNATSFYYADEKISLS